MASWATNKFAKPTQTHDAPADGPQHAEPMQPVEPPHAPPAEKSLGMDATTGLLLVGSGDDDPTSESTVSGPSARRLIQAADSNDAKEHAGSVAGAMHAWLEGHSLTGGESGTKRRLTADFDPRAHPTLYVVNTHLVRCDVAMFCAFPAWTSPSIQTFDTRTRTTMTTLASTHPATPSFCPLVARAGAGRMLR